MHQGHDQVEADLDLQRPQAGIDARVAQAGEHAADVVLQEVGEQQVGGEIPQRGVELAEWSTGQQ